MSQNFFWKSETCRNVWNYWRSPPLWDERRTLQLLTTEAAWRQGRGAIAEYRLSQLQNISISRDCQERQLPPRLHWLVHHGHWTLKSCQVSIKSCRICLCSTNSTKLLSLHFGGWTVEPPSPAFPILSHVSCRNPQIYAGLWSVEGGLRQEAPLVPRKAKHSPKRKPKVRLWTATCSHQVSSSLFKSQGHSSAL